MSAPDDGSPVPGEHRILRLPSPPKSFVPDEWRPTWQELMPSDDDKECARKTGRAVRVSVWDASLTTREQAQVFRGRPTIIISAPVQDVLGAGASAVVYDRLDPPEAEKPGGGGHAGIEGLERTHGEQRPFWKERLQRIADVFCLESSA